MPVRLPLLARLRRHRGLWLLAVCVLVLKFAAGSACLGDVSDVSLAAHGATAVAAWVAGDAGDAGCVLGEADCHCTCSHTLPVPSAIATLSAALPAAFVAPRIDAGVHITAFDSPLRPPIRA